MTNSTFTVVGMTCHSCAMTVTDEVAQVPGVDDVSVDLSTGRLTVNADSALDPALIKDAVEDAGYRLAAS